MTELIIAESCGVPHFNGYTKSNLVRGPLHTQNGDHWATIERSKIARPLNDLSKATKNPFLCEILVRSLTNLVFIERSLRDHWEINEIVESSLSAPWRNRLNSASETSTCFNDIY